MPDRLLRHLIRAEATLRARLGARVYPVDQVPANAKRPYGYYRCVGHPAETSMDSSEPEGFLPRYELTIVANARADVMAIVLRLPTAFSEAAIAAAATTFAGFGLKVIGVEVVDFGDEPGGPTDLDDGPGFEATVQVLLVYEVIP